MSLALASLLALFLFGCASGEKQKQLTQSWEGRNVRELETHPFFQNIPLKKKEKKDQKEVRIYEEQGKYRSKASCASLGGCLGLPSETCQNIFHIKKNIITKYEMKESCLVNPDKAPRD